MKSNFEFLKDNFPVLANFGELAEKYLYSDSNSCLMKLGMIGETIVNLIFTYDRISLPYDNTAVNRIDTLFREGMITRDLVDILHALRKIRNKAVHENYASVDDGKTLIQMAYSLTEWFMQTYGDWNYECKAFVMPSEKTEPVIVNKESEQKEEEKLIAAASEVAAASPVVAKEDRKKQAGKAASQRIKSEAETRYLIDEQLRKVGWEADTEHLRYSKGTRPAKGRNIAIAEWPTDSTVGNKGYADYALFIDNQLVATIEAKAIHKDIPSVIDYQCKDYSRNIRSEDAKYQIGTWGNYKVPFTFATNGRPYLEQYDTKSGVWFLDLREPDNAPKALKGWMSPTGMLEQLEKDIAARNKALQDMPYDLLRDKDGLNLREYQLKAIQAAENAILNGQQNVLLATRLLSTRESTQLGYRTVINYLKTDPFAQNQIDRIKKSDAKKWFVSLQKQKGKSYSSINNIRGILNPAFKMAVEDDLIRKNPFEFPLLEAIKNDSKVRTAITPAQEQELLDFIKADSHYRRYYEGYFILLNTGLRISEFCGLTEDDIDFENGYIHVGGQLVRYSDMVYRYETTKTAAGIRNVPMTPEVAEAFRKVIEGRPKPSRETVVDGKSGFLFLDQHKKPVVSLHWEHRLKRIVIKHNEMYEEQLPRITPHVLRHTFCSKMARLGMNPKNLQYIMGHSEIAVTMNTYTHLTFEDAQKDFMKICGNK